LTLFIYCFIGSGNFVSRADCATASPRYSQCQWRF